MISQVNAFDVVQAVEFIRALRVQLHEMTNRLAWVERQDLTGRNGQAWRIEAGALRCDIDEAQILIDRLQRRYLNANKHNERFAHA
jgi:hypothetical protein